MLVMNNSMKPTLALLTALLLAPLAALHAAESQKPSKPNFIVILSDDQSWVGTSQRMIPENPDTASDYGGGIYNEVGDHTLSNCIVKGNSAREGGGIHNWASEQTLRNCTLSGNRADEGNGLACDWSGVDEVSDIKITNSIFWDGGDEIFNGDDSKIDVTYSDVQGTWPGEGNIETDPCFAGPGYWDPGGTPHDANDDFWVEGDYHLKSQAGRWVPETQSWTQDDVTSRCIDAGDPNSPISLEPFPNGGIINMGAYGGTPEASKSYFGEPVCETIIAGDINSDCKVNFKDFTIMAEHWLERHSP